MPLVNSPLHTVLSLYEYLSGRPVLVSRSLATTTVSIDGTNTMTPQETTAAIRTTLRQNYGIELLDSDDGNVLALKEKGEHPTEKARDIMASEYRKGRAKKDLATIAGQLSKFRTDNGFLPTTEQGLAALAEKPTSSPEPKNWRQLLARLPLDPWGEPYVYRSAGDDFLIASKGPDRTEGNEDDITFNAGN